MTSVEDGSLVFEALADKDFEMLLSDIIMLELDGISLALKIAKDYSGLPALLMTGNAVECRRAHNLDVFNFKVVAKLFTLTDIREGFSQALAGVAP